MALCRFILKDEDFEELKQRCEEDKVLISNLLRKLVATFLGHEVSVRPYNHGHELEDKPNHGHELKHGHELNQSNDGHELVVNHGHELKKEPKIEFPKYTTIQVKDIPIFDPHTGLPLEDPKIG